MSKEEEKSEKKKKKGSPLANALETALKSKILSEKALQLKLHTGMQLLGQDLESEARTVLDCFRKPRLILERIQIIFNQTRKIIGASLKSKQEIRGLLSELEEKEYIKVERFQYQGEEKEAFILTEKGKELLD